MPVTTIRREETLLLKDDGSEVIPLTSQTSAHQPIESNNEQQTSVDNQNSDHRADEEAMVSFAEEPSAD
jgi:hypothetical protein